MPILRTLKQDFFARWSEEMAYVLGFFAADGSMLKNSRGSCFIEFTITDRVVIDYIRSVAGSDHAISIRERGGNCRTAYRLQIGSKRWFDDLNQLGFTQAKSKTLAFPRVPKEYESAFIRGYFDGDGCVYFKELKFADRAKKRRILMTTFTSGSKVFLVSLWQVLKKHDVQGGSIRRKERGFDLALSHKDSLALYKLIYHTGSTTGFRLPRKQVLLKKALESLYGKEFMRNVRS
ncbi:MAG TPA: LAGLIDADG family homing endonuclease [Candidatus Paceibacterota bacterium]|nr:LAGLIDADG family homing endonuclease [Candidatus Paceibacterota bacterium]